MASEEGLPRPTFCSHSQVSEINKHSGSILTLSALLKLLLGPSSSRRYWLDASGRKEALLPSHRPCHGPQLLQSHPQLHSFKSRSPSLTPPFSSQVQPIDFLSLPHSGQTGLGEGEVGWVRRLPFPTKMAAFVRRQERDRYLFTLL